MNFYDDHANQNPKCANASERLDISGFGLHGHHVENIT